MGMITKGTLLILAILCVHTCSMATTPRIKNATDVEICAEQTPCAWDSYKSNSKIVLTHIKNLYCYCPDDMDCLSSEDDMASSTYIYRCKAKTS